MLAGAVAALRILPPLTRLAQRYVDRTRATAAMLGRWQAGRRPHAGPVLLVALAVAVSALAWSLAGTTGRSLTDQADHRVGADLRLTETAGTPPADRAAQLARLPGVTAALPAWRATLSLGATAQPASLVAVDAGTATGVVRLRPDLADVFTQVTRARVDAPHTALPVGARRLTGRFTGTVTATDTTAPVRAFAVFAEPAGTHRRVPLGASRDGRAVDFTVDLPQDPARLAGFTVETTGPAKLVVDWQLRDLRADSRPVDLGGGPWHTVDRGGVTRDGTTATAAGDTLTARWVRDDDTRRGRGGSPVRLAVTRPAAGRVPLLVTPQALAALRLAVGDDTRLFLGAAEVDVHVVGTVEAFPGDTAAATVFADLPSLRDRIFHDRGLTRDVQEWWLSVPTDRHDDAVTAAGALTGVDVLDRQAVARDLAGDPFGAGARGALFAAALGAVLLAAVGIAVDVSATARRRATELAVLRALGATHRTVTRSLVTEQAFLAGTGVAVGLVAAALVTGAPRLTNGLADRSLHADLAPLPHQVRDLTIEVRAGADGATPTGAAGALERFHAALPQPLSALVDQRWQAAAVAADTATASGDVGPLAEGGTVRLGLRTQTGLPEATRLTAGTWPRTDLGRPVQVAVSQAVADTLALRPGVRLGVAAPGQPPADLLVTGVFQPARPADPLWAAMPQAVEPLLPINDGDPFVAVAVTDPAGLAAAGRAGLPVTHSWR
ncbi:FtsX-like permease family protein [Micromonospora inyonensis]|uniref:FtsX-like permease family protein n=1 Tax=Micromonospora inyonensis TaxID=47866 RepID=A0A1C6SCF4_9ACTN|nr:ABC transporter permease [Micromonospora inyonensis]SCL27023.1 FtsX-like permease family protein [Micromonospora inyonensis]